MIVADPMFSIFIGLVSLMIGVISIITWPFRKIAEVIGKVFH